MTVHQVSLEKTAVRANQYPNTGMPELAFVGRSNVGKSSLINRLVGRKALARVSSAPGKTATAWLRLCQGLPRGAGTLGRHD